MTISVNQQVDYLWKKIGYGVAKTDVSSKKDATNESVASAPFIPGDKIWSESGNIPGIIPMTSSDIVAVYSDVGNNSVQCVMDITSSTNRTWFTNLVDWIPVEFGSTYQIKVYLAPTGSITPQTTGIQLYAAGAGNSDEWFFDYESGVLNFAGDNLPNVTFSGHSIFVCGARYIGRKGLSVMSSTTFGNLTIGGSTISSTSDIYLNPVGNVNMSGTVINNVGYPTLPTDAATSQFVTDSILALHPNTIYQGDSVLKLSDPTGNAGVLTTVIDGNLIMTVTNTAATIGSITFIDNTLSSSSDIYFSPAADKVVTTQSTTAWKLPAGTTAERPTTPEAGFTRFNTTFGGIECFNGTDWASTQSQVSSQNIIGDGVQTDFPLQQATSANNILVMIQGVVQVPFSSYTVSGSIIVFNEAPHLNEVVEVRFISQSVSPIANLPAAAIIDIPSMLVGTTPAVIDSFNINSFRSAKYTLSILTSDGAAQMAELLVTQSGTDSQIYVTQTPITDMSSTILTYSTDISSSLCQVKAISSLPNSSIKIQKTYFTI